MASALGLNVEALRVLVRKVLPLAVAGAVIRSQEMILSSYFDAFRCLQDEDRHFGALGCLL